MKYLKYLIEDQNIQDLLIENETSINSKLDEFKQFIISLESYIYNNLDEFIDESNTFFNIKKYTVDECVKFLQEGSIINTAYAMVAGAGVGVGLWEFIKNSISNMWDSVFSPAKSIKIQVDDQIDNANWLAHKVSDSAENAILIDPEPTSFISIPLLTLIAASSAVYTASTLLNKYKDIQRISKLKNLIDSSFDRLTALGIKDLVSVKQLNVNKYNDHINKCLDKTPAFDVLEINISCPLDAYLTYCSSMILSLATVYASRVNISNNITSVSELLSIKDDFTVNQILTKLYNDFCFAIDFIYDDKVVNSKWKNFLDSEVEKFIKTIPKKPQVQVQQPKQPQPFQNRPSQQYVRPNRPNN